MKNLLVGVSLSGALALIALMAMTVGQSARADFNVSDPVPGSVAMVAVDMDISGNEPTALGGPVDTTIGGVPVDTTHLIDIVVDEIDVGDSLSGFGLDILYDPAVINITAFDFSFNLTGAIDFAFDTMPSTDGGLRLDVANFAPVAGLSGELILVRLTLKYIAEGTSVIELDDVLGGDGIPDVFDVTGSPLLVGADADGTITCGAAAPDIPDVEVTSVTTSLPDIAPADNVPDDQAVDVAFDVTADVELSNEGALDPLIVDTDITLNLPADCTTGDTNPVTVAGTSVDIAGSPWSLPQQSWSVICTDPSNHIFTTTATATVIGAAVPESDELTSNGPLSMAPIWASTDVEVLGVVLSTPSTPTADTAFRLNATVTIIQNSGFAPVDTDVKAVLNFPTECDPGPLTERVLTTTLSASEQKDVILSWTAVTCPIGTHEFSADGSVVPVLHVIDSDDTNDGPKTSAPLSVPVINAADLQVTNVTVTVPDTEAIDPQMGAAEFVVQVDSSVVNLGPFGDTEKEEIVLADITISLDIPPDCTATPSGSQTELAVELPATVTADVTNLPTKTWSVSCTQPSNHNFIATAEIDFAEGSTDIADPFPDANSNSGNDTTVITATADLEVVSVTESIPDSAELNVPFDVEVDSSVRNNGPFGPTGATVKVSIKMTDDCTRNPDRELFKRGLTLEISETATDVPTMTWSVTCTDTVPDTFTPTVTIEPEKLHVSDTDDTNDSGVPAAVEAATETPAVETVTEAPTEAPTALPSTGGSLLGGDLRSGEIGWLLVLGAFIVGIVTLSGGLTLVVRRVRRRIR